MTPATVQSKANDAGRLVESDAGRYPDSHNKNGICRTTSSSDPSGIDCIYIYSSHVACVTVACSWLRLNMISRLEGFFKVHSPSCPVFNIAEALAYSSTSPCGASR